MSKHFHQAVYSRRVQSNQTLAEFMIAVNGTVTAVFIKTENNPTVDSTVDVQLNGVSITTGDVDNSTGLLSITGLSEAGVLGDIVTVVTATVASNKEFGPKTYIQVTVDDGLTGTGVVETIVEGTGISVDDTDPANPIVAATGGGGGGSGTFNPDIPYGTPSTEDDEFLTGPLDTKWLTQTNIPLATFDIPNHVALQPGHATQLSAIYQAVPDTDRAWRMRVVPPKGTASAFYIGFFIRDSGAYYTSFAYQANNSHIKHDQWVSTSSVFSSQDFGVIGTYDKASGGPIYLEFRYISSTKKMYYAVSFDGITFYQLGNEDTIGGGAIDRVGIFCNGTAAAGEYAQVDWFRRLQGAYTGDNE